MIVIIFMVHASRLRMRRLTVTSFASILVNYFYILQKITPLRSSVLNFWGRLVKFYQKKWRTTT